MHKIPTAIRIAIAVCRWLYRACRALLRAARTAAAAGIAAACVIEDQVVHWRSQRAALRELAAAGQAEQRDHAAPATRPVPASGTTA